MYMNLKDFFLCILKTLLLISILGGLYLLCMFDYKLGIVYCNLINIPKDLAFTIMSPGMAIEVGIILFVFELVGLYFVVKLLRRNKYIDNFCQFLGL